jgi:hypothetical protein
MEEIPKGHNSRDLKSYPCLYWSSFYNHKDGSYYVWRRYQRDITLEIYNYIPTCTGPLSTIADSIPFVHRICHNIYNGDKIKKGHNSRDSIPACIGPVSTITEHEIACTKEIK